MKGNEKGFTLVEISIVLVIIGLLIGGVLKGQSIIRNAQTKRIVQSADELRAAIYTFYDRYGVFPGDESNTAIPLNDTHEGTTNGRISGGESAMLFEDLTLEGIINGHFDGAGNDSYPIHAFGGIYLASWVNPGGTPSRPGHYIRYDNLPWEVAREIDTKYDDGVYNTGSIRANQDYTAANNPIRYFYIPM